MDTKGEKGRGRNWEIGTRVRVLSARSVVFSSFVTPRVVARQAPLSMGFSRMEWGCHFLLQGIFPTQGWNLPLPDSLSLSHQGSPYMTDTVNEPDN